MLFCPRIICPRIIFLPTNLTNLHEFLCPVYLKATCSVARIFTNPIIAINNFGYAHIRVIRATEQVAILFIEQDSCRFVRFVGK